MSFNLFEESNESHKEASVGITGYPETLPAIKPCSPSQKAYTCVYHDQVQRPPTEHDFSNFSVPTLPALVDFKMLNLHACLCCVCVPPVQCEMVYKVTFGKVSRNLRKSVDLGDSVTMGSLTVMNCVNKRVELHTSFPCCDEAPSGFQAPLPPKGLLDLGLYEERVHCL